MTAQSHPKGISRRRLLQLGGSVAMGASMLSMKSFKMVAQGQITLRAADNQPAQFPTVLGLKQMKAMVEYQTKGRIKIDVFPGGQLGDERSVIEQVAQGVIDITRTSTSPVEPFFTPMGVYGLPYIFRGEGHMWQVVMGPIGREILDGVQDAGMVGLTYQDSGDRNFYTTNKAIRSPEDLKGLKIRTQQSPVVISMMKALGATPVPMAFGEVFGALQTGVIDGAENNIPSFGPFGVRHFEVAKNYTFDGHARVPEVVLMSKDSWDKLASGDQEIIREAALASSTFQATRWDDLVNKSLVELRKPAAGVNFFDVDTTAFQKAVQPVFDENRSKFGDFIDRILNTGGLEIA